VDPYLHQFICIRKFTKLLDFAYSCYFSSFTSFLASIHYISEPSSYKKAILNPLWQQAMNEELSFLHKKNDWDLIPLPPCKSVVGYYWVYKIKNNFDVKNTFLNEDLQKEFYIERYKARLVIKGYS